MKTECLQTKWIKASLRVVREKKVASLVNVGISLIKRLGDYEPFKHTMIILKQNWSKWPRYVSWRYIGQFCLKREICILTFKWTFEFRMKKKWSIGKWQIKGYFFGLYPISLVEVGWKDGWKEM